jgi:hypothetical protein
MSWLPAWVLPNLSIDEPVTSEHVALVSCRDKRLQSAIRKEPAIGKFLGRFQDEFGVLVSPSVLMISNDAPSSARSVRALASFRDAVNIAAIVSSHAKVLKRARGGGIQFSDGFDIYPWMVAKGGGERLVAITPAVMALHDVNRFCGQSSPALPERRLAQYELDAPLLIELLARWHRFYSESDQRSDNLALFRSLDMARIAARMPGGSDATFLDTGRSVALWVSAFEILAHQGRSGLRQVLSLFSGVEWERERLRAMDQQFQHGRDIVRTNIAGKIYATLNRIRNRFLHGEPVTVDTLILQPSGRHILDFAAPLYRLALTGFLPLRFGRKMPESNEAKPLGAYISESMAFMQPQHSAEDEF